MPALWLASDLFDVSFKPLRVWLWAGYAISLLPYLYFYATGDRRLLQFTFQATSNTCLLMALWIQHRYRFEKLGVPGAKWYLPWNSPRFSMPLSTRIVIKDVDGAARWYVEKLGLRKLSEPEKESDGLALRFKADGNSVVLTTRSGLGSRNTVILFTKKLGKMRDVMAARGVNVGAIEQDRQATRYFQVHDPEGNTIVIVQEP